MLIFDAIIIGEELYGLYIGLYLLNKYKSVIILEKDGNINNKNIELKIPTIFNDNHKFTKSLLKKYNIDFCEYPLNKKIIDILKKIINKGKTITTVILTFMSFETIILKNLTKNEISIIKNDFEFYNQLKNMNCIDAIHYIEINLLFGKLYTFKNNFNNLLSQMREEFINKGGQLLYNTNILNIFHPYNNYVCLTYNNIQYKSPLLFSTIKKHNLLNISYTALHKNILFNNLISSVDKQKEHLTQKVRSYLLDNYNLIFPLLTNYDNNQLYAWKVGSMSIEIYDKIRNPDKNLYLCNDIYSKKQGLINGGLEIINDNVTYL